MNGHSVAHREPAQQDNHALSAASSGQPPLSISIPTARPHEDYRYPSLAALGSRSRSPTQLPSSSAPSTSPSLLSPVSALPSRRFPFTRGRKHMSNQQKLVFDHALPEVERKCKEDPEWEAERNWLLGGPEDYGFLQTLVLSGKKPKSLTNILATLEKGILRRRIAASERRQLDADADADPGPVKPQTKSGDPSEPETLPAGDASLPILTSSPGQSLLGPILQPSNTSGPVPQDTHQDIPQVPNKSSGQPISVTPDQPPADQQPAPRSSAQPDMPSALQASTGPPDPNKLLGQQTSMLPDQPPPDQQPASSSSTQPDPPLASRGSTVSLDPSKLLGQPRSVSLGQAPADQQPAPSSTSQPAMTSVPKVSTGHPANHSPMAHSLPFSPSSTSPSTSIANFLVWTDKPDSQSSQPRPVSPADILDMPPIITHELSRLYSTYHRLLHFLDLHKKHGQPVPDALVHKCHRLKQQVERPWEQLQDSFLTARSRYIPSNTPNASLDPSLRMLEIPFTDLAQVKKAAARLKEQASVDAQVHFDRSQLPKSPALPQPSEHHGGPSQPMVQRTSNQATQHSPRLNTQPFATPGGSISSLDSPISTTARRGTDVHPTSRPQGLVFLPGVTPISKTFSPSIHPTTVPLANTYSPRTSHIQTPFANPLEPVRPHAHASGQLYHSPQISNERRFVCISPSTSQPNNCTTDLANQRLSVGTMSLGITPPSVSRSSFGGHPDSPALMVREDRIHSSPIPSPTTRQISHMSLSSQPSSPNLEQAVQDHELVQMGQQVYHHPLQAHSSPSGTHQFNQHRAIQSVVQPGLPLRARTGDHRLEADAQISGQHTQQHLGVLSAQMHRPPHTHVVNQPMTMHQQPLQAGLSVQALQRPPSLPSLVTETQLQAIHLSERAELEHQHHVEVQALEQHFRRWLMLQLSTELGGPGNRRHQQLVEVVQRMNEMVDQKRRDFDRHVMEMNTRHQHQRDSVRIWRQRELSSGSAGGQPQMLSVGRSVSSSDDSSALVAEGQLGSAHALQTGRVMDTGGANDGSRQTDSHTHLPFGTVEGDCRLLATGGSQANHVVSPQQLIPQSRPLDTATASPPAATGSSLSGHKRPSLSGVGSTSPPEGSPGLAGFRSTKRMRSNVGVLKMVEVAKALGIDWGTTGAAPSAWTGEARSVEADGKVEPVEAGGEAGCVNVGRQAGHAEAQPVEAGGHAGQAAVAGGRGDKEEAVRVEEVEEGEVVEEEGAGWDSWSTGACSASQGATPARLASPHIVESAECHRRLCEQSGDEGRRPAHQLPSVGLQEHELKTHTSPLHHNPAWRALSAPPTALPLALAQLATRGGVGVGRAPSAPVVAQRGPQIPCSVPSSRAPSVPTEHESIRQPFEGHPDSRAPSVSAVAQTNIENGLVSHSPSVLVGVQTIQRTFENLPVSRTPSESDAPQTTSRPGESCLVSRAPSVPAVVQTIPRSFECELVSRATSLPAIVQAISDPITSPPVLGGSVRPGVLQRSPITAQSPPMLLELSMPALPSSIESSPVSRAPSLSAVLQEISDPTTSSPVLGEPFAPGVVQTSPITTESPPMLLELGSIPSSIECGQVSRAPSVLDVPETSPGSGACGLVSGGPRGLWDFSDMEDSEEEDEGETISGAASDEQVANEVGEDGEQGDEEEEVQIADEALLKRACQERLAEALKRFVEESRNAVELIEQIRLE